MLTQRDLDILRMMTVMGGSFVMALGQAGMCADGANLAKLKEAFPEYWGEYARYVDMKREREEKALEAAQREVHGE